jgi:hypothetical protein
MTDIELLETDIGLLELAAKAADIYDALLETEDGFVFIGSYNIWNPITDDGDALRLAVTLKIDVAHTNIHSPQVHALADAKVQVWEDSGSDPLAATRRAIVRAAAEIGRNVK